MFRFDAQEAGELMHHSLARPASFLLGMGKEYMFQYGHLVRTGFMQRASSRPRLRPHLMPRGNERFDGCYWLSRLLRRRLLRTADGKDAGCKFVDQPANYSGGMRR